MRMVFFAFVLCRYLWLLPQVDRAILTAVFIFVINHHSKYDSSYPLLHLEPPSGQVFAQGSKLKVRKFVLGM